MLTDRFCLVLNAEVFLSLVLMLIFYSQQISSRLTFEWHVANKLFVFSLHRLPKTNV